MKPIDDKPKFFKLGGKLALGDISKIQQCLIFRQKEFLQNRLQNLAPRSMSSQHSYNNINSSNSFKSNIKNNSSNTIINNSYTINSRDNDNAQLTISLTPTRSGFKAACFSEKTWVFNWEGS